MEDDRVQEGAWQSLGTLGVWRSGLEALFITRSLEPPLAPKCVFIWIPAEGALSQLTRFTPQPSILSAPRLGVPQDKAWSSSCLCSPSAACPPPITCQFRGCKDSGWVDGWMDEWVNEWVSKWMLN